MAGVAETCKAVQYSHLGASHVFAPVSIGTTGSSSFWHRDPSLHQADIPSSENVHRRGFVTAIPHPEIVGGNSKGECHVYSGISTALFYIILSLDDIP